VTLDRTGQATIAQDTTLKGNLILDGTNTIAGGTIRFEPLAAPPAVAAPWQIYRTTVEQNGRTIHQLRVEIGAPDAKAIRSVFSWSLGGTRGELSFRA